MCFIKIIVMFFIMVMILHNKIYNIKIILNFKLIFLKKDIKIYKNGTHT